MSRKLAEILAKPMLGNKIPCFECEHGVFEFCEVKSNKSEQPIFLWLCVDCNTYLTKYELQQYVKDNEPACYDY